MSVDARCEKLDGMESWHCPKCKRLVLCIVPAPGVVIGVHCKPCGYYLLIRVPVDKTRPGAPIMRQSA